MILERLLNSITVPIFVMAEQETTKFEWNGHSYNNGNRNVCHTQLASVRQSIKKVLDYSDTT